MLKTWISPTLVRWSGKRASAPPCRGDFTDPAIPHHLEQQSSLTQITREKGQMMRDCDNPRFFCSQHTPKFKPKWRPVVSLRFLRSNGSWSRNHQAPLDTWIPTLAALRSKYSRLPHVLRFYSRPWRRAWGVWSSLHRCWLLMDWQLESLGKSWRKKKVAHEFFLFGCFPHPFLSVGSNYKRWMIWRHLGD